MQITREELLQILRARKASGLVSMFIEVPLNERTEGLIGVDLDELIRLLEAKIPSVKHKILLRRPAN
jgi:hypothetical protein